METEQPQSDPTPGTPDPDLADALEGADPSDEVERIQSETEEGVRKGDPDAEKLKDLQGALRKSFGYINMIGQQVAPPFEHSEDELDNLAVLWSKVLEDVPKERLMRFIERMPILAAGAYTVVTTGPKVRDSIQHIQKESASLESPESTDTEDDANANR